MGELELANSGVHSLGASCYVSNMQNTSVRKQDWRVRRVPAVARIVLVNLKLHTRRKARSRVVARDQYQALRFSTKTPQKCTTCLPVPCTQNCSTVAAGQTSIPSNMDGQSGLYPEDGSGYLANCGPSSNQLQRIDPPSYTPANFFFPLDAGTTCSNQSFLPFNGNLLPASLGVNAASVVQPIPFPPFPSVPPSSLSPLLQSHTTPQDQDVTLNLQSSQPPADSNPPTANDLANATKDGTWAGRNPSRPIIPCRSRALPKPRSDSEKEEQASAKAKRAERRKALEEAISAYVEEQQLKLESIAQTHSVTKDYVLNLVNTVSSRRPTRKPQLQNALVHAKAKEVNSHLAEGQRYNLSQVREMVSQDSAMQNLTEEQKQDYIDRLAEHRDTQVHGVRANNAAGARDVVVTTDRVVKELDSLRERAGIYATLFITRGHINDSVQSTWYSTDNSAVFWEDVFKHSAGDVTRQYEQWACAQGQNLEERDSLQNMRKQTTAYIGNGLKLITGKPNLGMNYSNYEASIIDTYGVRIVGWPADVPFCNPSNIGTVGETRKLRDALRSGACHWKRLTKSERAAFTAELESRRATGEQVKKARKKRADSGGTHKRKSTTTTGKELRKRAKKINPQGNTRSTETIEDSDGSGDELE